MKTGWAAGPHGQVAIFAAVMIAIQGLSNFYDFEYKARGGATSVVLSIGIPTLGAIAIMMMVGRYVDQRFPDSSFRQALTRLFGPALLILIVSSLLTLKGIGYRSNVGFLLPVGITVPLVAFVWLRLGRTPASPVQSAAASPAPPSPATQSAKRPWTHRITGGLLAAAWVPLGWAVLFIANYCPSDGTGRAVAALSITFVGTQLVGNPIAGWILDRRYGNRDGTLMSVGRSLVAAAVLCIAFGAFFLAIWPEGPTRSCN